MKRITKGRICELCYDLGLFLSTKNFSEEDIKAKYYIYTTDTIELVFSGNTLKELHYLLTETDC